MLPKHLAEWRCARRPVPQIGGHSDAPQNLSQDIGEHRQPSGGRRFPAPAISQGAAAKALRFVPQANLANFDPIWGTQYVVRNASAMVWDTLYGVNDKLQPQRQMVEGEEVSSDGLTWTFKLRSGLKFHDGEPVLAKDVVASLTRWMRPRLHGPDDQGAAEGADRGRRSHRQVGAVRAVSEDAVRARQEQHADGVHHAGAHRQDRSVPADHRVRRQRPHEVCPQRMGAGRQGRIREVRATISRATSRTPGWPAARR